ncbi:F5/8 type C domain containing protein [Histomonas meleagridis]|uniref:F5/8 type C domain containing protein n=1 Tax=Histomonas meleagridis TaxID=135588 RepID=UPI00355AB65E|nr:F5/8 type C domain containing protein [Histomonas meleagridis]KAH0805451.1 F5/8 type C domain containing protein [Histomonas meleagridis]
MKIFNQIYICESRPEWGELEYSSGIALIEFTTRSSASKCINDEEALILDGYVLKHHKDPSKIKSLFSKAIFIFFTSPTVTVDSLKEKFKDYQIESLEIMHPVRYNKPGMILVSFCNIYTRDNAVDKFNTPEFTAELPSYDFESLCFDDDEDTKIQPIIFDPMQSSNFNNVQYQLFLDFEIQYLNSIYRVNSFLASQHSTKIRNRLLNSKKSNRYSIISNVTAKGPFHLVVNTLVGDPIRIFQDNAVFLLLCSWDLGISQLEQASLQLIDDFADEDVVIFFCKELYKYKLDTSKHVQHLIQNFDKFHKNPLFSTLPMDIISEVLQSDHLNESSDEVSRWLFDFFERHDDIRSSLIPFMVKYADLMSSQQVRSIISKPGANLNQMRSSLTGALISSPSNESEIDSVGHECGQSGVFRYISNFYGKPASEIITVTGTNNLPLLIDPQSNPYECYVSPSIKSMWIQFDFRKHPFIVKSYTLQSPLSEGEDQQHLKSWNLLGSNDEQYWETLHQVENDSSLHGKGKINTWHLTNNNTEYKFLRILMTGPNWQDNHILALQTIEFYGNFTKNKDMALYVPGKEWNGIFGYLYKMFPTNPIHIGEVKIKTAADPDNLINPQFMGNNFIWRSSKSLVPPFLMFDFKNMLVSVDKYVFKTGNGNSIPTLLELQGSENGIMWENIDTRRCRNDLKQWSEQVFNLEKRSKPYRQLRIILEAPNKGGQNVFCLSGIEFFGKISMVDMPTEN